eukprot:jgi/Bigna1/66352/fgenesh1_pg.1_\
MMVVVVVVVMLVLVLMVIALLKKLTAGKKHVPMLLHPQGCFSDSTRHLSLSLVHKLLAPPIFPPSSSSSSPSPSPSSSFYGDASKSGKRHQHQYLHPQQQLQQQQGKKSPSREVDDGHDEFDQLFGDDLKEIDVFGGGGNRSGSSRGPNNDNHANRIGNSSSCSKNTAQDSARSKYARRLVDYFLTERKRRPATTTSSTANDTNHELSDVGALRAAAAAAGGGGGGGGRNAKVLISDLARDNNGVSLLMALEAIIASHYRILSFIPGSSSSSAATSSSSSSSSNNNNKKKYATNRRLGGRDEDNAPLLSRWAIDATGGGKCSAENASAVNSGLESKRGFLRYKYRISPQLSSRCFGVLSKLALLATGTQKLPWERFLKSFRVVLSSPSSDYSSSRKGGGESEDEEAAVCACRFLAMCLKDAHTYGPKQIEMRAISTLMQKYSDDITRLWIQVVILPKRHSHSSNANMLTFAHTDYNRDVQGLLTCRLLKLSERTRHYPRHRHHPFQGHHPIFQLRQQKNQHHHHQQIVHIDEALAAIVKRVPNNEGWGDDDDDGASNARIKGLLFVLSHLPNPLSQFTKIFNGGVVANLIRNVRRRIEKEAQRLALLRIHLGCIVLMAAFYPAKEARMFLQFIKRVYRLGGANKVCDALSGESPESLNLAIESLQALASVFSYRGIIVADTLATLWSLLAGVVLPALY